MTAATPRAERWRRVSSSPSDSRPPISVVSVVLVHPGRVPVDPWDDRAVRAQELQEAKQLLAEHGITAELLEPAGDPAATIERIAQEGGFDTVVVGSRGLGAVSRFLQAVCPSMWRPTPMQRW